MKYLLRSLIVAVVVFGVGCQSVPETKTEFSENWESLSQANSSPDWFRDSKFGIYTHWGPVSAAFEGGEEGVYYDGWHGMFMYCNKGRIDWTTGKPSVRNGIPDTLPTSNYLLHTEKYGDPAEYGYKYLIEQFDPTGYDPEEWAELFAASGAKFAGNVAMHHDNFAMWNSKATRWNSMNYGGIDVSKTLQDAVQQKGMKYIASFHHAFTWKYFAPAHQYTTIDPADYDLYTEPHALDDNQPSERFMQEWWAKLKEFIDVYQPDMLWFDWWLENLDEEYRKKFLAYYYNKGQEWGKEVAVCYKETTFPPQTAIRDYERGRPNQPRNPAWLTDTSPGAWFYRAHTEFKSANELIDILIDIVAKNGCMLLNVPPNPDGTIPQEMKDLLLEMGEWLKINGDAIYATRTWDVFGEGPTRIAAGGHKIEEKGPIEYTHKDIRFTKGEDGVFYIILMDTPQNSVIVKTLATSIGVLNNEITSIELLGSNEEVKWKRMPEGLVIKAATSYPTGYAHAYKVTLKDYVETDIGGAL